MTKKGHKERKHAVLGASSSNIWLNCPGAPKLWAKLPPGVETEYAKEGTAAHELGEKSLLEGKQPKHYLGKTFNGVEATEEMIEAVKIFTDYVIDRKIELEAEMFIEKKFNLEWIYKGMFGTNDAALAQPFGLLEIIDYKHGAGKAVEVEENSQLIYYALGALKDIDLDFEEVKLTIVQPRAEHKDGPIRSYTISIEALQAWAVKLKEGAIATTKKDAPLNMGDHCQFCNAQAICPLQAKNAIEVAKTDFVNVKKPQLPDIESLSDEQIANIIKFKTKIEGFLKNVKTHAENTLKNGGTIEGVKLVNKKRRRDWTEPQDELIKTFGDSILDTKLQSVAKAEKLFGPDAVSGLWANIDTGLTVAHETDRRKSATIAAKDDFQDFKEITEDSF